jgi:hypothetical protein
MSAFEYRAASLLAHIVERRRNPESGTFGSLWSF